MALSATPPLAAVQICLNNSTGGQMKVLSGIGDPNSSSTDSSTGDLAAAGLGSVYLRQDGVSTTTFFYVKTAAATPTATTGVWTGK